MCAQIHDTSHITYEGLLEGNKKFIEGALAEDPQYFDKLANGQKPPILWIGCADSRVPANQITNTAPGEIFVHRNIANMVIHSDMNMLSVLDYAVNVLKVKHVIVTGHYGCGGVNAAMSNNQFGLIDNWLRHIKDVYRLHADELDAITDETERSNRLVELNVIENVNNLCKTSIVQNAWKNGQELSVHGWVYSLSTGLINDMKVSTSSNEKMDAVFKFK
ncbi:carbonate dehydratase [Mucilaginibacter rubeus]|uniref:Carbonic anhydrase 2 n=1 Tax=Mucilaginibacter rubeus TaxID=2027860 RepID=A0AAE6MJQ9_9SPHI|nr:MULTISPECIES: carbonate dehydratase [Mucilaginibacter]QEM05674.1 carbonate dehydratase [Mucilaginibacter rubeus]QEM18262.1 carbonate dehydratase [Mucilaginibacter gossypii]QTE45205.1 carbonate dehydratase [Mucilaginibacter rubeus]QTE51801.1 carbonate dehydratase [Mucilaginibacter rubeus]QTE56888.1 carbonate dehydratase [Mucilaginibacter rubeus]